MSPLQQRAMRVAMHVGGRVVRRRVERSRSLRWAVRMPLVTLALSAVVLLAVSRDRLR